MVTVKWVYSAGAVQGKGVIEELWGLTGRRKEHGVNGRRILCGRREGFGQSVSSSSLEPRYQPLCFFLLCHPVS
jgi:hypothetical protein